MPAEDGQMTAEELSTAYTKLNEFWAMDGGRKPCRSCGDPEYWIMPHLSANRSDNTNPMGAHTRLPAVVVMCRRCGYMEQYLSSVVGVPWLEIAGVTPSPLAQPTLKGGLAANLVHDLGQFGGLKNGD